MSTKLLDHGYVELVESWGSDECIIEAARMSTGKGFQGWGPRCDACGHSQPQAEPVGYPDPVDCPMLGCEGHLTKTGDEKLLAYLWNNRHTTPFEMAGAVFEVKAPIFVFREWHRHRTQSYNEMSARYIPLPDEDYIPSLERLRQAGGTNKQAQGAEVYDDDAALRWRAKLPSVFKLLEVFYREGLRAGIPKELARIVLPVGRYSKMRASANLLNWLRFLGLRNEEHAMWEIRQYAQAVQAELTKLFPRTLALFESKRI